MEYIENETGYYFLYNKDLIDVDQKVSITIENLAIPEILNKLLSGTGINYTLIDHQIVLASTKVSDNQETIVGKITDEAGIPLPGVTILVKGTNQAVISDLGELLDLCTLGCNPCVFIHRNGNSGKSS